MALPISNRAITRALSGTHKGVDLAVGAVDGADQGQLGLSPRVAQGASPQIETKPQCAPLGVVIARMVRAKC